MQDRPKMPRRGLPYRVELQINTLPLAVCSHNKCYTMQTLYNVKPHRALRTGGVLMYLTLYFYRSKSSGQASQVTVKMISI
jgi:hypothetical protein